MRAVGLRRGSAFGLRQRGWMGFGDRLLLAATTRLRMRYRPEDAHSDVVLYPSRRIGVNEQLKYIDYNPELEFAFPSCDEGAFADPGTCPQAPAAGCHLSWPGGGGFAAMGLAVLLRRRRSS